MGYNITKPVEYIGEVRVRRRDFNPPIPYNRFDIRYISKYYDIDNIAGYVSLLNCRNKIVSFMTMVENIIKDISEELLDITVEIDGYTLNICGLEYRIKNEVFETIAKARTQFAKNTARKCESLMEECVDSHNKSQAEYNVKARSFVREELNKYNAEDIVWPISEREIYKENVEEYIYSAPTIPNYDGYYYNNAKLTQQVFVNTEKVKELLEKLRSKIDNCKKYEVDLARGIDDLNLVIGACSGCVLSKSLVISNFESTITDSVIEVMRKIIEVANDWLEYSRYVIDEYFLRYDKTRPIIRVYERDGYTNRARAQIDVFGLTGEEIDYALDGVRRRENNDENVETPENNNTEAEAEEKEEEEKTDDESTNEESTDNQQRIEQDNTIVPPPYIPPPNVPIHDSNDDNINNNPENNNNDNNENDNNDNYNNNDNNIEVIDNNNNEDEGNRPWEEENNTPTPTPQPSPYIPPEEYPTTDEIPNNEENTTPIQNIPSGHSGGSYSSTGEYNYYSSDKNTNNDLADGKDKLKDTIDEIIKGNKYSKIPSLTTPIKENVTKKEPNKVIPIAAGLSAAAAAGLGAKAYMDHKKNNDNGEDEEIEEENKKYSDDFTADDFISSTIDIENQNDDDQEYLVEDNFKYNDNATNE